MSIANTVLDLRDSFESLKAAVMEHSDSTTIFLRASLIKQEKEAARRYVAAELDKWRNGRKPLLKPKERK